MRNENNISNRWFKQRTTNLLVGFIVSISLCLMAFNYTSYSTTNLILESGPEFIDETIDVVPTVFPKPKKKVIPPPDKIETSEIIEPDDDVEIKEPDLIPLTIDDVTTDAKIDTTSFIAKPIEQAPPLPKPAPLPPPREESNIPEIIAETMPYYGECSTLQLSKADKKRCSDKAFFKFLYDNIKYPKIAQENNIQGTVYVEITLGTDGKLQKSKILKDIGGGCGEEALRVIKLMDNWSPARQGGRAVRLRMRLPVKFVLN